MTVAVNATNWVGIGILALVLAVAILCAIADERRGP